MVLVEVGEAIVEQDRRFEIARNLKLQRADEGIDSIVSVEYALIVTPPFVPGASCADWVPTFERR